MIDPNNRPGGPNLIVTAKTAHKVHFLDAATLTLVQTIDMPGSTHELVLSPDGRTAYGTVYGDGVFAKRVNPDRRLVVIDLAARALIRVIDLGAVYAPHGIMMDAAGTLWCSGELGGAVLAVDPASGAVEAVEVGATAHWIAVRQASNELFVSCKRDFVAVVDATKRAMTGKIALPGVIEGLAISPDGATLYCCAQGAAEVYVVDIAARAVVRTLPIDGANGAKPQMRRAQVSPDNKYLIVSSNQDHHAAIYTVADLRQIASFAVKRGPMGFGFAPDGRHAYLCCHDDAEVLEFELATGHVTRTFPTAAGCEFIIAYH